jgi:hypothetical protein
VRRSDTFKAIGLALTILVLNLIATTVAISAYAIGVAPGRSQAFYQAAAPGIAAWTAPAGGALMFLTAVGWLGRRWPERRPYAFALRAWLAYVILDVVSGVAMGPASALLTWPMALSMTLALAGALAGAALARPRNLEIGAAP